MAYCSRLLTECSQVQILPLALSLTILPEEYAGNGPKDSHDEHDRPPQVGQVGPSCKIHVEKERPNGQDTDKSRHGYQIIQVRYLDRPEVRLSRLMLTFIELSLTEPILSLFPLLVCQPPVDLPNGENSNACYCGGYYKPVEPGIFQVHYWPHNLQKCIPPDHRNYKAKCADNQCALLLLCLIHENTKTWNGVCRI